MTLPFILLLLACCIGQGIMPNEEGIYVTNSTGGVITSFSVTQHEDIQILQCHAEGVSVDWSILPRNNQVEIRYGGYLNIHTEKLLPRTTFTISAATRTANYTLEFDISVDPCEYGNFTLLTLNGFAKGYFQLYQGSELIYNNTLTSKYFCLPRQTYQYAYYDSYDVVFSASDDGASHFHTAFFGRYNAHEGSFSNEYSNPPSISFPSVVSSLRGVEKKFFIATDGVVDSLSINPTLPVDFETSTFSILATNHTTTTYTITAVHGADTITSVFTLYVGSCPEGTSYVIATPSTNNIAFALPSVETPISYQYEQSFCLPAGSIPVEFFGHRLSSTTSLRFTEHGHTIFEFLPSSDKIDYYHFVLERQMPVRFDSQLAFLVGTPGPEWAMLRFKEKGWNRAQEGKWGCFDSAGKAYFRATFSVRQPMEFNYVLMNVRGEGTADILVNGAQVGTGVPGAGMPAQIIALSSTLVKGNNVVAVSLSKGGSQVILFALEVVLTNTPDIQLTEGEASAVQQDPKTQFPPSAAFDNNEISCWKTEYLPARLTFTFDAPQVVNYLVMKPLQAHYRYLMQVYGENKEGRTLLGTFNYDLLSSSNGFAMLELHMDHTQPFQTYHFAFNSTNPKADMAVCDLRMFGSSIFTCPKKHGYKDIHQGTTLYRGCPLFRTGRESFTCVRDGASMQWVENRTQCYTTMPSKNLEFVDWTFTIKGMSREAWKTKQQDIVNVLIETTYLHVSEIEFLYEDFSFDEEKTVMKGFARCTIDTLLGELIKRSFERLRPVFGEKVAAKIGTLYEASIDSVELHHYVNWALVISLSVVGVIVAVALLAYVTLRLKKRGGMKKLKKNQESLLPFCVCSYTRLLLPQLIPNRRGGFHSRRCNSLLIHTIFFPFTPQNTQHDCKQTHQMNISMYSLR